MTYTYDQIHEERFRQSRQWIKDIKATQVLEVGAPDAFTATLKTLYPNVQNTDFDLRSAKGWDAFGGNYDFVVCMEVLEHINEPINNRTTIEDLAQFRASGAANMLKGIFDVSRSGAKLFLTTPNGSSVECIRRGLNGHTPIAWQPHVREYGWRDVQRMVQDAGWKIERFETIDCYLKFRAPAEQVECESILYSFKRWPIKPESTIFLIASKE